MDEILDVPVVLPELPTNPFEDEFKAKWYDRYRNDGCTKEHLQRLYNLDKLTEEDFITITGENPSEKTPPPQNEVSKLQDKISILEAVIKDQDQLALDQELRIAMLELNNINIGGLTNAI